MTTQRNAKGLEYQYPLNPDAPIRIDHICISERERRLAEAYLRKAEGMVELIQLATRKLRSAAAFVGGWSTRTEGR